MSEEQFYRKDVDALTLRMIERFGKRRQKINQMKEWEAAISQKRSRIFYVSACAACLVLGLTLTPFFSNYYFSPEDEIHISAPSFTEWRSATDGQQRLSELMQAEKNDSALLLVEELLMKSDSVLESWYDSAIPINEETEYEHALLTIENEELQWACIYLLLKLDKRQKAVYQLERYLRQAEGGKHLEEAKDLLKVLKNE